MINSAKVDFGLLRADTLLAGEASTPYGVDKYPQSFYDAGTVRIMEKLLCTGLLISLFPKKDLFR